MKKITIYIPTYNRSKSLLKQLEAINTCYNKSNIQVVVSNNDSADIDGYNLVEEFCCKNKFLYIKNSINIGADANIFNGFLNSFNSEYIWILSDDDLLKDNAVDAILEILSHNDLDILFLTFLSKIKTLEVHNWTQNDFYENNLKTGDGAGLISNVIYRSGFIKESIPVGFQNIYTCFCHLAVLIHSLKNKIFKVGNIGDFNFFISGTSLPPEDYSIYSKSYFGFVLLGHLFEDEVGRKFINNWVGFWNLKNWYTKKRDKISEQNYIYAKAYIVKKISTFGLYSFKLKLFFWYFASPFFILIRRIRNVILRRKYP